MINFILKLISLYKMFNFDSKGNLCIKFNGSKIMMTKEGDIALQAKRHLIYKRKLSFNGCDDAFINEVIEAYKHNRHEEVIERYNLNSTLDREIEQRCPITAQSE